VPWFVFFECKSPVFGGCRYPDSDPEPDAWNGEYFEAAKNVYGLIHARFIITEKGMQLMARLIFVGLTLFSCCLTQCMPVIRREFMKNICLAAAHGRCATCTRCYQLDCTMKSAKTK
jgi:Casein kinase II regulatory subunit